MMMKLEKVIVYFSLFSNMKIPNYVVPDNFHQNNTKPCCRNISNAAHTYITTTEAFTKLKNCSINLKVKGSSHKGM